MINSNRSGWILFGLAALAFLSGAWLQHMLFRPADPPVLLAAARPPIDEKSSTSKASDDVQEHPCHCEPEPHLPLIDINNASASQLTQLPGIGPAYAERIVAMRQLRNGFRYKEELLDVSGIGRVRFEQIVDLITVGPYEGANE